MLPLELHTDASKDGLGAVLVQRREGKEEVLSYASRSLTKTEQNYSTTERECLSLIWALNKFRPYVYGRHVTVVTDHHSLCWLAGLKDPHGRLARWALLLQEQDVTIVHRSGKLHQDADCLSRLAPLTNFQQDDTEAEFPCLTFDPIDVKGLQRGDNNLAPIIRHINDPSNAVPERIKRMARLYELSNGVLYKKAATGPKLVVPPSLRDEVMYAAHDDDISGHMGVHRTFNRMHKKYYWPLMRRSVQRYVRSCQDCQTRKNSTQAPQGMQQPLPVSECLFDRVGIDFLGPFPRSSSGNKHIIVCTEYLSKWAETKAVPAANAESVAKFFMENIVYRFGAPKEILSDQGTPFMAELTETLLQKMGTKHVRTTAYHPRTNGLTERFNKTLADMLSMYTDADHKNWDASLAAVTFAYNTAQQETTGKSPFFLQFGREATLPMDTILPVQRTETTVDIQAERQRAAERIKISQDKSAARVNCSRRSTDYSIGQLVYVWRPSRKVGRAEKLLHKFHGPFRVVRKTSPVNYEIAVSRPRKGVSLEVIHADRLKPAFLRGSESGADSFQTGGCDTDADRCHADRCLTDGEDEPCTSSDDSTYNNRRQSVAGIPEGSVGIKASRQLDHHAEIEDAITTRSRSRLAKAEGSKGGTARPEQRRYRTRIVRRSQRLISPGRYSTRSPETTPDENRRSPASAHERTSIPTPIFGPTTSASAAHALPPHFCPAISDEPWNPSSSQHVPTPTSPIAPDIPTTGRQSFIRSPYNLRSRTVHV